MEQQRPLPPSGFFGILFTTGTAAVSASLAVAAAKLLPHCLDHFPLARHRFQRPGHVFAELAQAIAAAAFTRRWRIDHHALAGKMIGERVAFGARARLVSNTDRFVGGTRMAHVRVGSFSISAM